MLTIKPTTASLGDVASMAVLLRDLSFYTIGKREVFTVTLL
jgi:hypothetical protein